MVKQAVACSVDATKHDARADAVNGFTGAVLLADRAPRLNQQFAVNVASRRRQTGSATRAPGHQGDLLKGGMEKGMLDARRVQRKNAPFLGALFFRASRRVLGIKRLVSPLASLRALSWENLVPEARRPSRVASVYCVVLRRIPAERG